MISVVIISRNEGSELAATVGNLLETLPAGERRILIPGPARIRFGVLDGDRLRVADVEGGEPATMPVRLAVRRAVTAAETRRGLRVAVWDGGSFDLLDELLNIDFHFRVLSKTDVF